MKISEQGVIELQDVVAGYNGNPVWAGATFTVNRGEFVAP